MLKNMVQDYKLVYLMLRTVSRLIVVQAWRTLFVMATTSRLWL
jgi:hypothetical protein